jgi:farnesyl-diphosphate farnesyltransferase
MGAIEILSLALTHPNEFRILLQFWNFYLPKRDITKKEEHGSSGWDRPTMRRCWELLDHSSRSFSAVIKELDGDLARVVSVPCLSSLSIPHIPVGIQRNVRREIFHVAHAGCLCVLTSLQLPCSALILTQICLFYVVLRGLDTIEDDMSIPDDVKQPLLRSFHEKTVTPGWNFNGNGPDEKDRIVLVDYHVVVDELLRLEPACVHTPLSAGPRD